MFAHPPQNRFNCILSLTKMLRKNFFFLTKKPYWVESLRLRSLFTYFTEICKLSTKFHSKTPFVFQRHVEQCVRLVCAHTWYTETSFVLGQNWPNFSDFTVIVKCETMHLIIVITIIIVCRAI